MQGLTARLDAMLVDKPKRRITQLKQQEPSDARAALFFQPDGRVQFIYDDRAFEIARLARIGKTKIERASNVEPTPANTWRYDFAPLGDVWPPGFALTRGGALEAEKREIETLLGENRIDENSTNRLDLDNHIIKCPFVGPGWWDSSLAGPIYQCDCKRRPYEHRRSVASTSPTVKLFNPDRPE